MQLCFARSMHHSRATHTEGGHGGPIVQFLIGQLHFEGENETRPSARVGSARGLEGEEVQACSARAALKKHTPSHATFTHNRHNNAKLGRAEGLTHLSSQRSGAGSNAQQKQYSRHSCTSLTRGVGS
jgi:hypothetical protein